MDSNNKKSSVPNDVRFSNLQDDKNEQTRPTSGPSRSSIKSLITKKFQPLTTSTSITINNKPKKPRTSFRHFSQFLKRSHSAHTDLTTPTNPSDQPTTEPTYQSLQIQPSNEYDSSYTTRSITTTNNTSGLVPITEEDNPQPRKHQLKSKTITDDVNTTNSHPVDQPHVSNIAPSLSKYRLLLFFRRL